MIECPYCGHNRQGRNSCPKCGRIDREVYDSIQISPQVKGISRNHLPPRTPNNSFEKGNRLDERGLAYLDHAGSPLKMKETFDETKYNGGKEVIKISTGGNS